MKKVNTVEEYLADLPADQQTAINIIRRQIKEAAPNVIERISWGVPVFKVDGKYIAGVAAYKNHISFTPWGGWNKLMDEKELGDVEHTDTLLHFSHEKMIPESLVKKLISLKVLEIKAKLTKTKKETT